MTQTANPLAKHFRQPAMYLKLPSNGNYWPEGSLEMPVTGEIPVYPMTTKDEIILRTPDALLNGEGIVQAIESCCPNIKDAWKTPSVDVDPILIAIRIASYGSDMDITSRCQHCDHENLHTIDLGMVTSRFRMPDFHSPVEVEGLKIKIRPQEYQDVNKNSIIAFEEQRILQAVSDEDLSDNEKIARFNQHMGKLISLNVEALANSTEYVETPDGERVRDKQFLIEFYDQSSAIIAKSVRDRIDLLAKDASIPKVQLQCEGCEKDYEVSVEFNYASFFGNGS